jgi:hypothetical protein
LVAVGVVFAAVWLSGIKALGDLPGQPEIRDGTYYASNHGSLIPLTKNEYDAAVQAQLRLFSGGVLMCSTVALGAMIRTCGWLPAR